MSNKFVVTSQVKNYIYFDALNNQFKVPKHKLKYLFKKSKIHNFNEISKIKLLEMEDERYCAELEIMLKLQDNTKYYISLIKKPTSKNSFKYKNAYKIAEKIISHLYFIQSAMEMSNSYMYNKKVSLVPNRLVTE